MIKIIENNNEALQTILNRSQLNLSEVNSVVETIIEAVKLQGDSKLIEYTSKFDQVQLKEIRVTETEINNAFEAIDPLLINDLKQAMQNIYNYHKAQVVHSYTLTPEPGVKLMQRVLPIEAVGIYIPGGTAAYPSTVLMNAVPAKIAGVKRLVMITPPQIDGTIKPSILVAAKLAGVDEIYKVGGAQGIAALAYGTKTIRKVDKIVGPGNIYVAMAKRQVSGYVGIDMIAGPSEILVIADKDANPDYIAADLMSQAEHDTLAAAICVTTSKALAVKIVASLERQIKKLKRNEIIIKSLNNYGAIVLVDSLDTAVKISNKIGPEHLEILTNNPELILESIENAGSIFIGAYTPEPVGDYFAGPNHTLPTSGTSRFSSGLSTTDFIKKTSVSYYEKSALFKVKDSIIRLANEEGLTAHANAVAIRFKQDENN